MYSPSTGRPSRDFGFELVRQTQETIKPIERDVRNMAHVSRPSDLHGAQLVVVEGFPQNRLNVAIRRRMRSVEGYRRRGRGSG